MPLLSTSTILSWSLRGGGWPHHLSDTSSCVPPLQVYDTPPMAVKGPNGQDPGQEIYDVPPSVEKNLHQTVSAAGKLPVSLCKNDKQIFTGRKIIY